MSLAPKDPDVPATYSIKISDLLLVEALRDERFVLGALARPQRPTGYYYQATPLDGKAFGRSGAQWPTWPRMGGETVVDGSITWTAVHPADATLPTLSDVDWTLDSALTLVSQSEDAEFAHVTVNGGTAGEEHDATARMTFSDGRIIDQTITIPVKQL